MRTTIERVRAATGVGAALVSMIVAGFLWVAHVRAHRLLRELPERLGADIQKETNGFTYSQSVKGRTVFTIHAAKATQHKDGRMGLHDVGIVLYGEKDGRADRIYGKEFEYDQRNGIVRARGEVQLDLQAPAPTTAGARAAFARDGAIPDQGPRTPGTVHVVTSGLVYVQSLGVASTDQPIRFAYRGLTGQSRGASYRADTGVTTLEREVKLAGLRDGRPALLTADHAELDRVNHRMTLRAANYVLLAKADSDRGTGERMSAATLVLHLADGGGIESVEASGGVELGTEGSTMRAPQASLDLTPEGRPERMRMAGGVRFWSGKETVPAGAGPAMEGRAETGEARFGARGEISVVHLTGAVQAMTQEADVHHDIAGDTLDLRFAGAAGAQRFVQEVEVQGNANVRTTSTVEGVHGARLEEARADVLRGVWQQSNGTAFLREVTGTGHTEIHRLGDGVEEVSRGERLHATFAAGEGAGQRRTAQRGGMRGSIVAAVQEGAVTMERRGHRPRSISGTVSADEARAGSALSESKARPAETDDRVHGRARAASYDAASGRLTLTGGAEIDQASGLLRADRIQTEESSGDAEAEGSVQVTYRQAPGRGGAPSETEPVHAVGAHASLQHDAGTITVNGLDGQRARLWQGASQVEAPVLVFAHADGGLEAFGTAGGGPMQVLTVLVRQSAAGGATAAGTSEAIPVASPGGVMTPAGAMQRRRSPEVLRVRSGQLQYAQAARTVEFKKGVLLEDANGSISSREAVATLASETGEHKGTAVSDGRGEVPRSLFGGGVEQIVARYDVILRQPGRVARGAELRYTAAANEFVLTGGQGAPPNLADEESGSVTGTALRFHAGDNSVTIDGRPATSAVASGDGRVHTRTRAKR